MKSKVLITLILMLPIASNAMIVFDPSNYAQNMMTASNSASSLLNQAQMIQNQIQEMQRNWEHLGSYKYQELASLMQQLDSVTQQGQALSYSMKDRNQQFNRYYPNYVNQGNTNYQQAYGQWNETTLNTLHNTLNATSVTANQIGQENQLMEQLKSQNQNATGNMQALQVSNEIAMQNVEQLQLLKRLIAAQQNSQTAYMASQVSRTSYEDKVLSDVATRMPGQYPQYRENPEFGLISQ